MRGTISLRGIAAKQQALRRGGDMLPLLKRGVGHRAHGAGRKPLGLHAVEHRVAVCLGVHGSVEKAHWLPPKKS